MFKPYTSPKLSNDEVLFELEKIQKIGWDVYSLESPNQYLIDVSDGKKIYITFEGEEWGIKAETDGYHMFGRSCSSIESLRRIINEAARSVGIDLRIEPLKSTIRIKKNEPASNKVKLVQLIGGRSIKCIYDPYFDTHALKTLLLLNKLGLKFHESLRCLTGSDKKKGIDPNFVEDFAREISTRVKLKTMASKEHRRFLILNDNKVIIIGCSLNDLDKNEALLEEDSKDDIDFFESEWNAAENIV